MDIRYNLILNSFKNMVLKHKIFVSLKTKIQNKTKDLSLKK